MLWFPKNHACSIGVDIGDDSLRVVQLGNGSQGTRLIYGGGANRPLEVEPGSGDWQRWAIDALRELFVTRRFRGRNVIATIPAKEVFIDHIKMPKIKDKSGLSVQEAIVSRVKHKLPFEAEEAVIRHIPAEDDNVIVIASERRMIDRYLAVYEKSQLLIKSMVAWPAALTNVYVKFFGRRRSDVEAIVCLVDIEPECTKVVICRHRNPLFVRSIPIGSCSLEPGRNDEMMSRLMLELTGCRRQFSSMYKRAHIERLIFLSGRAVDKDVCMAIAKQFEVPAQMGDCLAAVEISSPDESGIDRRGCQVNWATAFGLSLS